MARIKEKNVKSQVISLVKKKKDRTHVRSFDLAFLRFLGDEREVTRLHRFVKDIVEEPVALTSARARSRRVLSSLSLSRDKRHWKTLNRLVMGLT